jgi:hypothetical protein
MDTLSAMAIANSAASMGAKFRVFDWHKAAELIRERKPKLAMAGLEMDMEYTAGVIFERGLPQMDGSAYLASNWAIPVIELDGEEIPCWIWEFNEGHDWGNDWNENTRWPNSALAILNAKNQ